MKKYLLALLLLLTTSCAVTGRYTGSKYAIGADDEIGVYASVKFFDSDTVTKGVVKAYEWVAGDEDEKDRDKNKEATDKD
jgi:hypothetical protein